MSKPLVVVLAPDTAQAPNVVRALQGRYRLIFCSDPRDFSAALPRAHCGVSIGGTALTHLRLLLSDPESAPPHSSCCRRRAKPEPRPPVSHPI